MARISHRIGSIAESATLAVDAKAKALKAAGRDVVGFGAGEPDFPTPAHIVEAAAAACRNPRFHKYTPTPGLPELREAIADKTKRDSGYAVTADQVLVTNGGKQAVYNTFATLLDPGDEALLPAPYWTTYPEAIALAGGTPVVVETTEATGYLATIEQLEAARTPRTKLLLFCSPSTPRPRPSRPPARTSSASAPVSPTFRLRPTSSRPPRRLATMCAITATHRRRAFPSCGRRSRPRPPETPGSRSPPPRCW